MITTDEVAYALDKINAPKTACGGDGDAEVSLNVLDRIRCVGRQLAEKEIAIIHLHADIENVKRERDAAVRKCNEVQIDLSLREGDLEATRAQLELLGHSWNEADLWADMKQQRDSAISQASQALAILEPQTNAVNPSLMAVRQAVSILRRV